MDPLSRLYREHLARGLVLLRDAISSRDYEWAEAEVTLLHNIPSLLDEPNIERHRYFWFAERVAYIEWASAPGREASLSRMKMYYEPLWLEMEPILRSLLSVGQADMPPYVHGATLAGPTPGAQIS